MAAKLRFKFFSMPAVIIIFVSGLVFGDTPPWSVPDTVEGMWKTLNYYDEQPETIVKVYVQNDTLFGVITDIIGQKRGSDPRCELCTDSLKNVQLKGLTTIWGCTKKDRNWTRGRYLDVSNGKTYRCDVELNDNGDLHVFVYVNRIFKAGRTLRWVRIQ